MTRSSSCGVEAVKKDGDINILPVAMKKPFAICELEEGGPKPSH